MSILLEALRKSEKNQQTPESPDIHKEDVSSDSTESIQTGPLAVLLVLALFLSGWFVWGQYRPPEGVYQPPVTLAAGNERPATPQAQQPVSTESENAKGQGQQAETIAASPDERPRTPVESYQDAIKKLSSAKPVTKPVEKKPAETKPATQNQVATAKSEPVNRPPAEPAATDEYRPQEPAPISYWELPDAVREDVPEIKFSVLVYAQNAEDRFVLINGQRMTEGAEVQPGLEVKEIRRDGVIFSYRLYQFLVER